MSSPASVTCHGGEARVVLRLFSGESLNYCIFLVVSPVNVRNWITRFKIKMTDVTRAGPSGNSELHKKIKDGICSEGWHCRASSRGCCCSGGRAWAEDRAIIGDRHRGP